MALTTADVTHVARLARLRLTEDELEKMRLQLSQILEHVQMLAELDTTAVPPTAQVTGLTNVWRPDAVMGELTPAEALRNAPEQRDGMFRVPAIFEE